MSNGSIFISHAGADRERAEGLAKDLAYEGFNVWIDLFEIEPSENWLNDIQEGLDNASIVLVVWTEAAENSRWVPREVARADDNKVPVIPLLFDDTKINITLQTTQPIDFRGSYLEAMGRLISKLQLFEEDFQSSATPHVAPWKPVRYPTRRNHFLDENHYFLDCDPFAVNRWTSQLASHEQEEGSVPSRFVSIVAVPIAPRSIFSDHDTIEEYLGEPYRPDTGLRELADNAPNFRKFPAHALPLKRTSQIDCVRYEMAHNTGRIRRFLRITIDGEIEYADSYYLVHRAQEESVFQLVGILGAAWQIAYLATELYLRLFQYDDKFQLLINMIGGSNSLLAGFASRGTSGWRSVLSPGSFRDERAIFRCTDPNLQFTSQIDPVYFDKMEASSSDMIADLSKRIQRSFNLQPELRHNYPNSDEFDWDQYWRDWR